MIPNIYRQIFKSAVEYLSSNVWQNPNDPVDENEHFKEPHIAIELANEILKAHMLTPKTTLGNYDGHLLNAISNF